jgi:hypothetical protein
MSPCLEGNARQRRMPPGAKGMHIFDAYWEINR